MRIFLDAMGGDNAPQAPVAGALEALRRFPRLEIVLAGDPAAIEPLLKDGEDVRSRLTVLDTLPDAAAELLAAFLHAASAPAVTPPMAAAAATFIKPLREIFMVRTPFLRVFHGLFAGTYRPGYPLQYIGLPREMEGFPLQVYALLAQKAAVHFLSKI